MISAAEKLKQLRLASVPPISIRKMAEEVGIGFPRYSYFEDPKRYKKRELPIDVTRKIAAVLSQRGVDPAEVMLLAGLNETEAEPEARAVEAARPAVQFVALQVALPSEPALREMFAKLLVLVPDGASKDETAQILAQWLPSGFAGIGPYLPDPGAGALPSSAVPPQSVATDDRESPRP
ncbi:helix-turn-helix domain-containing protein [Novosphingobium guangzhouense]|uniref:helix-turn-helix domain-containing protein n=1 Tax=Novosphingobium guangzhouense TaxID=1850347 RepID=UPI0011AEDD9F|nr:helix-turn-helix transcriptional regulator [Novosphingobium guangzhouense]